MAEFPRTALPLAGEGCGEGESRETEFVENPPHPKFALSANFDLSPQAGRGDRSAAGSYQWVVAPCDGSLQDREQIIRFRQQVELPAPLRRAREGSCWVRRQRTPLRIRASSAMS